MDEITDGIDELGVLLMGHKKGAYWYGSQLDIDEARELAPYNNATSIQVCAPRAGGHRLGARESRPRHRRGRRDGLRARPRDLHALSRPGGRRVQRLDAARQDRGGLFPEDLDPADPWQFKNFRVT